MVRTKVILLTWEGTLYFLLYYQIPIYIDVLTCFGKGSNYDNQKPSRRDVLVLLVIK